MSLNLLQNLKLPSEFIQSVSNLMDVAEMIFGAKSGEQKKAWVKNAALDLAAKIDIPVLPEAIERPLEEMVIDMVIEVLWAMLFDNDGLLGGQEEIAAEEAVVWAPMRREKPHIPQVPRRQFRHRFQRNG